MSRASSTSSIVSMPPSDVGISFPYHSLPRRPRSSSAGLSAPLYRWTRLRSAQRPRRRGTAVSVRPSDELIELLGLARPGSGPVASRRSARSPIRPRSQRRRSSCPATRGPPAPARASPRVAPARGAPARAGYRRRRRAGHARRRLAGAAEMDTLMRNIANDEAMLIELGEDHAERRISRTSFHAAGERVQGRLDVARSELAAPSRPDVLDGIEDLALEWSALGLERQRAIIDAVLAEIAVGPARGSRNRFDPTRIAFRWRASVTHPLPGAGESRSGTYSFRQQVPDNGAHRSGTAPTAPPISRVRGRGATTIDVGQPADATWTRAGGPGRQRVLRTVGAGSVAARHRGRRDADEFRPPASSTHHEDEEPRGPL